MRWLQNWTSEHLHRVIANQEMHPTTSGVELAAAAAAELDYRHRKDIKHWLTYDEEEDGE